MQLKDVTCVTHVSPQNFISQGYASFIWHLRYGVEVSWRMGDNQFSPTFNRIYSISSLHHAPFSCFIKCDKSFFQKFSFLQESTDLESNEMASLLLLLDSVQLCSSSDKFIWTSDLIGIFSSSTFFFPCKSSPLF